MISTLAQAVWCVKLQRLFNYSMILAKSLQFAEKGMYNVEVPALWEFRDKFLHFGV
jgi:hypothetical protein